MLVLVGYGAIIHLLSFVVLVVNYNGFKGRLEPLDTPGQSPPPGPNKTSPSRPTAPTTKLVIAVTGVEVPTGTDGEIDM
jgi:hypothetical protein